MRLLKVYPIQRGIPKDALSYFTGEKIEAGAVISVPLRNKTTAAVVTSVEEVAEAKTEIRKSDFTLRKIAPKAPKYLLYSSYIRAIVRASEYYAATPGALLAQTIPRTLFIDPTKLATPKPIRTTPGVQETTSEKLVFQGDNIERLEHHKNLVREEFASRKSVFILVPTIQDGERLYAFLSRGIPQFTYLLHSGLSEREARTRWNKAVTDPHPIVIIGTGSFLSLPRYDLGTIIVERENSSAYKSIYRPFADMRVIAERLAEEMHVRLIFADSPLSVSSMYRVGENDLDLRSASRSRSISVADTFLIDMREEKPKHKSEKFVVLGKQLLQEMAKSLAAHENIFLFTARRGLSPITVCEDCGNAVLCDITKTPVILHKGPKGNVFVCHSCGAMRPADERCRTCGSWKLQTLGIGSELVEEIVREIFPDAPIFVIDKDKTKTHREAVKVAEKFANSRGAILLGTEMALSYLPESVPTIGIVSIDSLLSLPEWNAYERVFGILIRLRSTAGNKLIVQSRKTESEVLDHALKGALNDFYRSEIDMRKQFGYPPFSTFIKITVSGSAAVVEEEMKEIERVFAPFGLSGRSHLMHTGKNIYMMHAFLRIDRSEWPKNDIVALLKTLPPDITVTVDPESIL